MNDQLREKAGSYQEQMSAGFGALISNLTARGRKRKKTQ